MGIRTLPETDHDILISMWTLLIGTNGEGLIGKFDSFREEARKHLAAIDGQLPKMWTREEHAAAEREAEECNDRRNDRRKISLREWIMISLTAISVITVMVQAVVG